MALTSNFVRDMYVIFDGQIHHVMDRMYKTQGRQGGLIILKMRNLNTGNTITHTLKSGMKLEEVNMETKEMQYLYSDDSGIYFMDMETYDTVSVPKDVIGDYIHFLKEGDKVVTLVYEGKVMNVKKNPSVVLEVIEAVETVKGNTATNATKQVTLETGYKINVPMFINKGDKLVINTDTCQYTGRSND